jgi:micrococcal nuclease
MSRRASLGARLAQVLRYSNTRPKAATRKRSAPRSRRRRAPAKRAGSNGTNRLGIVTFAFVTSALCIGWALGGLDVDRIASAAANPGPQFEGASFSLCTYDNGDNCVIDGDTFRYRGTTIRIADIDTPEAFSYGCPSEKALGDRATRRLHALLNTAPFALKGYDGRDEDQHGRKLRVVTRDGRSLGMMLVAEGLAREWDGARRPWC